METVRICTQCRKPLPENSPATVCALCSTLVAPANIPTLLEPRSAPEPAELAPSFPELEIIELLPKGGMGMVYKARHSQLERLEALKILPLNFAQDPFYADRFAREAKALAQLNHSGIVVIYDSGRAGPYYFFRMEYVDGKNLRQMLDTKSFSLSET